VKVVQVDILRVQALQAALDAPQHGLGVIVQDAGLGRQEDLLAPALEEAADQLFGGTVTVTGSSVEVVHSQKEGGLHGFEQLVLALRAPLLMVVDPAAQAQG